MSAKTEIIESWMENKFEISSPKSKWKKGRKEGDEVEDPEMRLNMKRCQINKKKERKFQSWFNIEFKCFWSILIDGIDCFNLYIVEKGNLKLHYLNDIQWPLG